MNVLVALLWKSEAPFNLLLQMLATDGAFAGLLFRLLLTEHRLTEVRSSRAALPRATDDLMSAVPRRLRPARDHELLAGRLRRLHGRGRMPSCEYVASVAALRPEVFNSLCPCAPESRLPAFMKLWTRLEVTREESEGEEGEGEEGRERRQQERERRQRERERRQELERQGIYQLYVHICPSATLPAHAEAVPRRRQELPEEAFEGRRTPKEQVRTEKGIKEDTLYGGTIPRTYLPWVSSLRIARLGL